MESVKSSRKIEIGQVFGAWTVIGNSDKKSKSKVIHYKCRCSCGTERDVSGVSLRHGISKSCGCLPGKRVYSKKSGPPGEATLNALEASYRGSAKGRKLEFSLTREQFRKLITSHCQYCGEAPKPTNVYMRSGWGVEPKPYKTYKRVSAKAIAAQWVEVNGIDRIDNSKGYSPENSAACCIRCNIAKMNGSVKDFLEHAEKIINFQRKK